MNRTVRLNLFAVVTAFCMSASAIADASAQGPVPEILTRMENHYKALSSLRANVRMEEFNPQTGERSVRQGNLIYVPRKARDAAFRIDWGKPTESLSVFNGHYKMYRPELKVAYVGLVNSVKGNGKPSGVLAFLNMSKADLKANYEINYVGQENIASGTPTWHLQLVPKMRADYKNADIWVDKDGMPIQMKQTENNNGTTTILLSNLNKNSKTNLNEIPIDLPKDVKEIPT